MKKPRLIEFNRDCLKILRSSLLAVSPQEGCALLIGDHHPVKGLSTERLWRIELIWPCCNIWAPGIFNIPDSSSQSEIAHQMEFSRDNRFALDPREQLHAQKWARTHKLKVLGSAHSHPSGEARPSLIDISWCCNPGLMVIVDRSQKVLAWWMAKDQIFYPLKMSKAHG